MNHFDKLQLLPSSLYSKDSDSNHAKLWRLFVTELNYFEDSVVNPYELNSLPGVFLDKIGIIIGKERVIGQTDEEYRSILRRSSIVKEINSLYGIYRQLSRVSNVGIRELYRANAALTLDGGSKLNGNFRFDPLEDSQFLMDGSYYMDNTEPLDPSIRPAAFLVRAQSEIEHDFEALYKLTQSIKPVGVSAYLLIECSVPNCDTVKLYRNGILVSTNVLEERDFVLSETSVPFESLPALVTKLELYLSGVKIAEYAVRLYFAHFIKYKLEVL